MKGQTAIEMIAYIAFIMLILVIAMVMIVDRERIVFEERIGMDSKAVAETVASEINIALSVGDGYSHRFTLPAKLYGEVDYTIEIANNMQRVYIEWNNRTLFFPILTSNITGTVEKGDNTIRNQNGAIIIE